MSRNKLVLIALSSVMIVGAAAGASVAAPGDKARQPPRRMMGEGMRAEAMREVAFVRMLKQFDTNKDGQISKQEAQNGIEKVFAAIDENNDGALTPGEIRKHREAQMVDRKAPDDQMGANDDAMPNAAQTADNGDQPTIPKRANHDRGDGDRGRGDKRWGMRDGGRMVFTSMMRRMDTDENGQISRHEAEAAFDRFFIRMDRNKDGAISIDDMPNRPFL
ncbi:EF-hand domain pair [Rhizobium mongolense subsp. loessense]|uniref:EF-hand domain pair n=1 Tax=Rhizobium mongolense subsp. loessense TaxID=158890 RepID=A0A1G4PXV7_9HYPH|nr:EF-hand domain-containing protein [Rhizobium mongolense]SCW36829.1 EF-hand domain pair [Rhizobium mongolense subsp. loessense]